MSRRRRVDPARLVAFGVLRQVTAEGAYANLALAGARAGLSPRDAGFVTELVSGTARLLGTYDRILTAASGRETARLDPDLLDALRLGCHQLLSMRVPDHAAVAATVELAAAAVGERTAGLTNAVLRKVSARDLAGWVEVLGAAEDETGRLALATHHPRWIVEAWQRLLPDPAELAEALAADNIAPRVHLAVRPGLAEVAELGGQPLPYSPFGAVTTGDPGALPAVAEHRAGAQRRDQAEHRHPGDGVASEQGVLHRRGPPPAWQQRVVDVHPAVPWQLQHPLRDESPVGDHRTGVGGELGQPVRRLGDPVGPQQFDPAVEGEPRDRARHGPR